MTATQDRKAVRWSTPVCWGMVLVLLVAALLRLAALPELPLGLHYDEAANLILVRQMVEDGYRPLFIRAYTGKEALFFYAVAPWVWITGGTPWGLRLGAAMIGVLTVAATFAAVRALFAGRPERSRLALMAAGWIAIAFPHVLLSRYGFRAISQPLLQALTVAMIWRGLRNGRGAWLVAGGITLGLTAYTYLAARLFPIPLGLALIGWLIVAPQRARVRRWGQVAVVSGAAIAAFVPLGIFFLRNPDTFLTRIAQVAAPSWRDAFDGVWRCLQALVWPGAGDGYIRFNAPGAPVMRPVAAVLALLGLIRLLSVRRTTALEAAGRLLVVAGGLVMILPSALATGEITPSNLRMVGIYPFLAVLPAWGLHTVLQLLPASWSLRRPDSRARFPSRVHLALLTALLLVGAALTAWQYRDWAASGALFQAADGEMTLAAAALDAAAGPETTVYVASEHYRHPTVAALAMRYADAKWLTGGATLVLPPAGDAVTIVPDSQRPPAPWPAKVAALGEVSRVRGPAGDAGVTVTHLSAAGVAASRAELRAGEPVADFAHVVWVHSAAPATLCRAGEPCPMLVAWEPRAPYSALQPVVRFLHTETGEWARTMAFHYPSEQWTPGELVLDQLLLALPVEMPPGGNYRIGVGFFDPDREEALPRLVDERYAGSEVRFPLSQPGIAIVPATAVPSPAQVAGACPGVPRSEAHIGEALSLLGAQVMADATLLPGSPLTVRLCWQALAASPAFDTIMLLLSSTGSETVLFAGAAAPGYGFERWRAGEVIETRHPVRIPRDLPAGDYALTLQLDEAATTVGLDTLSVAPLARRFAAPETANAIDASFSAASGELIRLVGYELFVDVASDGLGVTLVWQALAAMEEDYVVFLHLRDAASDALIVQVDEMPQSPDATAAVRYPTSLWMPGEVITDRHTLALPEVPLSGAAYLYVGLYLPEDGTHLTVAGVSRLQLASFPEALLE